MRLSFRELLFDSRGEPLHLLSDKDHHSFQENGFIHLPAVYQQEEIVSIREECGRVACGESAPTEHLEDGFRSWRAVTTVSPELAGVACDPRLVGPAIQLLGPSLRLVGTQLIYRAPHHGPRVVRTPERPGWHRDIYGMNDDLDMSAPFCAVKCAIWLTDAVNVEDGATRFLPGSHKSGLPEIPPGQVDPPGWTSPIVRQGDVTVFENRTAHAGGLNTSDRLLIILMIQYGYRWLARVTRCAHPASLLSAVSPFARQILEPDEVDFAGRYCPGAGTAAIVAWARRLGIPYQRQLSTVG